MASPTHAVAWTALALCSSLCSCASQSSPIRSALVDLTGESRTIRVYDGPLNLFPVASQRQVVSVAGLLTMPDVGMELQFSPPNDVTTALGVAVAQSYRLIGETRAPEDPTTVTQVRDALERVETLALEASVLTAEMAAMRDDGEAIADEDKAAGLEKRRRSVETELRCARNDLRRIGNTPGVIIARWDAGPAVGAAVQAGDAWGAGWAAGQRQSGFVILGGVRMVSLIFGEDFWWLLNNLREEEKKHIEDIGLTTHLVQAKQVAYTSSLNVQQIAAIQASIGGVGRLRTLDSAKLALYWSFVGEFTNSGNLPPIEWKREPFCLVCSMDLPGLAKPNERALQKHFGVEHEPLDPASYQGWRTITANILNLHDVPLFFKWRTHAATYAKDRIMHPSPSCPYCKDKGPARIETSADSAQR